MSDMLETAEERLAHDLSRRKHFRLECSVRASIEAPSAELAGDVIIRNIGLGGARVDIPVELPMPCAIRLILPGQNGSLESEPAIELSGQVAWTVADRAEGPFPTGIQFAALDEDCRRKLFRYIACLMR